MAAAAACPIALAAPPQEPPASLERYRCTICHAPNETLAGPAFADVAAKYAGDREAVAKIAYMIRHGVRSGAPWHMPPHPEVSAAEARTMARYIMSLSAVPPGRTVAWPR
jgi:cytochrome c